MLAISSRCKIVIEVSLCPTWYFCAYNAVQKDQDVQGLNCHLEKGLLREVVCYFHPICPAHLPPQGAAYANIDR